MGCAQPPERGQEPAQSPPGSPAAVPPVLGRRAALGSSEGGDPAPPGGPRGRGLTGPRISAGLAVPRFGVLGAGLATPRPGGPVREASAAFRLGLRFLRRRQGREAAREPHGYILQVPDEPREPSTISGPWSNSPVPTLSTTTNGTRGLPSRTYGGTLPTSSGVPLPRISTVWLAGWTSGAS
ncbi:collagen alpha-1(I) chain-like [Vulpes lagopus]|uniref:collagen alpha-1(I) chain-like n=1 Tax=Vulpes lagopus TaxID=494514 RepID=UPI001BC91C9A|nr:collagen alpha-1(I) chain-like [Vulpes lagopus]